MANCLKLIPILLALALLAGVPAAVSGQEPVRVSIEDSVYTATEGTDSAVEITVVLSSSYGSDIDVELDLDTECSTGGQLEIDDSTITISAGNTSQTVSIDICNDTAVENEIDVRIRLQRLTTTPTDVSVNTAPSVIRLADDPNDSATVGFTLSEFEFQEAAAQSDITLELTGTVCFDFTVLLETIEGTADSPGDFRAISRLVTFNANCENDIGEAIRAVRFTLSDDLIAEATESLRLTLSRTTDLDSRISISPAQATVSILDNDSAEVSVRLERIRVREDSGTAEFFVNVLSTARCPVQYAFEVQLSYTAGTAIPGSDFYADSIPSSIRFEPCQSRRGFRVELIDDARLEDTEDFSIILTGVTRYPDGVDVSEQLVFGRTTTTIEIIDSDRVTISPFQAIVTTVEGPPFPTICARRLGGAFDPFIGVPVQVHLSVPDAPGDIIPPDSNPIPLTFRGGTAAVCTEIEIVDDGTVEEEEHFQFILTTEDPRVDLVYPSVTVEVIDTDIATASFDTDLITIDEGESFDLTVELAGDPTCPVAYEIDYPIALGAPSQAISAFSTISRRVTFKPCETTQTISVDTSDIAATAELRFALPSIIRRVIVGQPTTATVFVIDRGGTTEAFETLVSAENNPPWGIWSDGQTAWISNENDHKIYAYDQGTKGRDSDQDFDTLDDADNDRPTGIWSNGTTMWVADYDVGKIYAYRMSDKTRDADKDFDTLSAATNANPTGLWSNGTTMWVADYDDGKIYAYNMTDKTHDSSRDFNALAAGNGSPEGIWSNGTTMWVADSHSSPGGIKIYAYDMDTKERVEEKEFNALIAAGQSDPKGIWSNGEFMWVVDKGNDKIYAFYFPAEPVLRTPSRRTSTTTRDSSSTDESDPARPSVIEADQCVADIVDPDGGRIELGDTIDGRWVSGCPSVTRGGRLAKYYTFDLPITTAAEIALDSHLDDYLVLRRGGLSGAVVEQDDDDGPGNNSLIAGTLTAGRYTIEATTFYADGVEADFTLSVRAVPRILYDGPVSAVAKTGYAPAGPTMTVKLLPTLPMGTLEITVEDPDGFGEGAGPLGGTRVSGGSAGTAILALPKTAWVDYAGITVETLQSGPWTAHTEADEQAMLTRRSAGPDLSPILQGLVRLIGKVEGAMPLLQSLAGLTTFPTPAATEPDESVLDAIFRKSHANCVSQVTVPWLVDAGDTTGVRISVPVSLTDTDYLSLAASFVASGRRPALAQLHDLLATGGDAADCQPPSRAESP